MSYSSRRQPKAASPAVGGARSTDRAAFTIVSKNYLAYARILAESFSEHHPSIPFFVLLVDRIDGYFDPCNEPFDLIRVEDIVIPMARRLYFKYTVLELNTAVKPFVFEHLFNNFGFKQVLYFDPDILIVNGLHHLFELLGETSIILTPHLTAPLPDDGRLPGELNILQAGAYNLGFVGLADTPTTRRLLEWWQERLIDKCQMAVEKGMHVDQKWMDLVPGFFGDTAIVREPGYNVAYWNLPHRSVELSRGRILVNGQPGYFFHFSGIDPLDPRIISKHDTRLTPQRLGAANLLFERYRALTLARGYAETRAWPYAFGHFNNGVSIPDLARRLYLDLGVAVARFGDPFDSASPSSFFSWLNEDVGQPPDPLRPVSRLWHALFERRRDLQDAFPDVFGRDRQGFLDWQTQAAPAEHGIAPRFIVHPVTVPPRPTPPASSGTLGVNIAGHFESEKGVGEVARSMVRNMIAAGVPHVLNNFVDENSTNVDATFVRYSDANPYPVNVLALTAAELGRFAQARGDHYFADRRNVAHWAWELADFPRDWLSGLANLDELWVASSFIRDALSRVSPVPVVTVPYSLTGDLPHGLGHRLHFGLPRDAFVFLCMFDFSSISERKNPLGAIKAFKRAFSSSDDVLLLVKCAHSQFFQADLRALQMEAVAPNIRIMDCVLSREQVATLLYLADCYVSLHRAEGFGLPVAEAMSLGKPVIATGYSGNMDFMSQVNSFPCSYQLTPIVKDQWPYQRDFVWADPDLDHAATLMRFVYENRDIAGVVGQCARRDVMAALHPRVVGQRVRERLMALAQ